MSSRFSIIQMRVYLALAPKSVGTLSSPFSRSMLPGGLPVPLQRYRTWLAHDPILLILSARVGEASCIVCIHSSISSSNASVRTLGVVRTSSLRSLPRRLSPSDSLSRQEAHWDLTINCLLREPLHLTHSTWLCKLTGPGGSVVLL